MSIFKQLDNNLSIEISKANRGIKDDYNVTWWYNGKVREMEYYSSSALEYVFDITKKDLEPLGR